MARRTRAPFDLTRKGVLAHTCGQRMAQAFPGALEWFRANPKSLRGMLNPAEAEAFDALLPATWWAGFQRGWAAAEKVATS